MNIFSYSDSWSSSLAAVLLRLVVLTYELTYVLTAVVEVSVNPGSSWSSSLSLELLLELSFLLFSRPFASILPKTYSKVSKSEKIAPWINYSSVKSSLKLFYSGVPDKRSLNLHYKSLRKTPISLLRQFLIRLASSTTMVSKAKRLKKLRSWITKSYVVIIAASYLYLR